MRQERTETGIRELTLWKDCLHDSTDSGLKGTTLPSYSTSTLTCSQKPRQVKPLTSINISAVKANLPTFHFMGSLPAPSPCVASKHLSLALSISTLAESQVPTSTGLPQDLGSPSLQCFFLEPPPTPHSSSVLESQLRHRWLWMFPTCLSIWFLSFSYSGSQLSCILLHSRMRY